MSSRPAANQTWNAAQYAEHGRFVSDLGAGILEWLAPRAGEEILDIGCGDGALTEKIAQTGASVQGVDTSASMVEAAQRRGLRTQVMDATRLTFHRQFDAVFSNAALHWVHDQTSMLHGIAKALKPSGRFVAEMGGHGNIAAIRVALHAVLAHHHINHLIGDDNYFPTIAEYSRLLEENGFHVEAIELVSRPTPLPSGMRAWLQVFRVGVLQTISADLRETVLQETLDHLCPALCDADGIWTADYVRLRFCARLRPGNAK